MTITTIEQITLSREFRYVTLPICFERFDWSLAIGYVVSTSMASLLWTFADKILAMYLMSNRIMYFSNLRYKLLMLTKIIK